MDGHLDDRARDLDQANAALAELAIPERLEEVALRVLGVRLDHAVELRDLAAIGLTIVLWRNTELEDAHSGWVGRQRAVAELEAAGLGQADLEAALEDWDRARQQRGSADAAEVAYLSRHPALSEERRLDVLRADVRHGLGIPDDVMFRMNDSTCAEVLQMLLDLGPSPDQSWAEDITAGIWDPDRPLTIGDQIWEVADIYEAVASEPSDSGYEVPDGALHATAVLNHLADTVGFDAVIRLLAIRGAWAGMAWAGTPWWPEIVDRVVAEGRREGFVVESDDVNALQSSPAEVRGPVAQLRVRLHWATSIDEDAAQFVRSACRRAAGLNPDLKEPLPAWLTTIP